MLRTAATINNAPQLIKSPMKIAAQKQMVSPPV